MHHRLSNRHLSFQHLRCQSSDLFRRAFTGAAIFVCQITTATVADLLDVLVRGQRAVTVIVTCPSLVEGEALRRPQGERETCRQTTHLAFRQATGINGQNAY